VVYERGRGGGGLRWGVPGQRADKGAQTSAWRVSLLVVRCYGARLKANSSNARYGSSDASRVRSRSSR